MHIDDGVLLPEIWLGGFAVAGVAVGAAVWRFKEERVPEVAVLTSLFFVASLVQVPLGGTSVHLLLTGLVGIVLGWLSIPSVFVALFFQKILLGHGGFTTLGVNTVIMGCGALVSHLLFFTLWRRGWSKRLCAAAAFLAAAVGVLASGSVLFIVLKTGGQAMSKVAAVSLAPQLAISILDGLVTASAVAFLLQVKPDMLEPQMGPIFRRKRASMVGTILGTAVMAAILSPGNVAWAHNLEAAARLEDGQVVVEASFARDSPVRGARVRIWEAIGGRGESGRFVAVGTTDEVGRFSFHPERAVDLVVVVEDRMGHRAVVEISSEKLRGLFPPQKIGDKLLDGEVLAVSQKGGLSAFGPEWLRVLLGLLGIGGVSWLAWRMLRRRGLSSRSRAQEGSRAP